MLAVSLPRMLICNDGTETIDLNVEDAEQLPSVVACGVKYLFEHFRVCLCIQTAYGGPGDNLCCLNKRKM